MNKELLMEYCGDEDPTSAPCAMNQIDYIFTKCAAEGMPIDEYDEEEEHDDHHGMEIDYEHEHEICDAEVYQHEHVARSIWVGLDRMNFR